MISARSSPINHRYMKKESLSAEQEKIAAQSVSVAVHGGEMFFAGLLRCRRGTDQSDSTAACLIILVTPVLDASWGNLKFMS